MLYERDEVLEPAYHHRLDGDVVHPSDEVRAFYRDALTARAFHRVDQRELIFESSPGEVLVVQPMQPDLVGVLGEDVEDIDVDAADEARGEEGCRDVELVKNVENSRQPKTGAAQLLEIEQERERPAVSARCRFPCSRRLQRGRLPPVK